MENIALDHLQVLAGYLDKKSLKRLYCVNRWLARLGRNCAMRRIMQRKRDRARIRKALADTHSNNYYRYWLDCGYPPDTAEPLKLESCGLRYFSYEEQKNAYADVSEIHLSCNDLVFMDSSIARFNHLTHLDLSYNSLTVLPEFAGGLRYLRTLRLAQNELTRLPESIGSLTALRELDLSTNELTRLPETIGQCTSLTTLHLQYNLFDELPDTLCLLVELEDFCVFDTPPEARAHWHDSPALKVTGELRLLLERLCVIQE